MRISFVRNTMVAHNQGWRGMIEIGWSVYFLNQPIMLSSFLLCVCLRCGVVVALVWETNAFTICMKNITSQTMHVNRKSTLCLINSIHSYCGPSFSISSIFVFSPPSHRLYSVIFEGKVSPLIVIEFKVIRIDFFVLQITITKRRCYIFKTHSTVWSIFFYPSIERHSRYSFKVLLFSAQSFFFYILNLSYIFVQHQYK